MKDIRNEVCRDKVAEKLGHFLKLLCEQTTMHVESLRPWVTVKESDDNSCVIDIHLEIGVRHV